MDDKDKEHALTYPHPGGLFSFGAQEVASRLKSEGYEEKIIFIEFESANIDFILISELASLAAQNKEKKIVLISSKLLLPLARLYGSIFNPMVFVFSAHSPLPYLVQKILLDLTAEKIYFPNQKVLSIKEAVIIERSLKGVSIHHIGKFMGLDPKTIYHWRRSSEKKLGVRKLTDLRLRMR
jgi:DNA-binding CsgD family transcriptional regulator